jgi:alpha-1,2-rhamnosyltransferase
LGAELRVVTGYVRPQIRELFDGNSNSYLTVAAFDPRKNHAYLLDAFDLLWQQQPDLQLCLVGRIGSRCDQLIDRVAAHPKLGRQLHLFDDLSDAELQHCYRDARGVIFPSIVEGFGLPIVESLWFGRKTFVSDTAIHREVGRSDCCYFGLDCPSKLAHEILDWEREINRGACLQRKTRRPTTWRASCEQLLEHCLDSYAQRACDRLRQRVA